MQNNQAINILWTGGMDSTFRLAQLIFIYKKKVQPYYIIDEERVSTQHELRAMEAIKKLCIQKNENEKRRLLLFAEMKLQGEAWLEFNIDENNVLHQIATFRPKGVWGRIYWLATSPFHYFIFNGMIKNLARYSKFAD